LGESPIWHPEENRFYWLDMRSPKIFSLKLPANGSSPTNADITEFKLSNPISGMAPKEGGGVICSYCSKGIGTIDIDHKKKTVKEDIWGLGPNMLTKGSTVVTNDAKCSPEGRYFAGQKDLRSYDVIPADTKFYAESLPFVGKSTGAAK